MNRINCFAGYGICAENLFFPNTQRLIIQAGGNIEAATEMLNVWQGLNLILHIGLPIMKGGAGLILL